MQHLSCYHGSVHTHLHLLPYVRNDYKFVCLLIYTYSAAKWELAEAKRAAKWELAEAKRLAKAAATAVKEAALAEKKRKTLKAQQDKEMDASIRNFGGQDGWEADCMHEAALVEMQRARHTLERVQALPHVARRAPHIVVAAVELVIKAKAEVDLTASALTAYPKAAAAGEQARASSSSSSTIGYSSEVKLPPSQTGDQISPDSVVAMSISPAILPLPTSASVTPNSGGDKKRKRVEVGIAPVSADGSKILEEDANTDFIDLVAASCSFDHAQTVSALVFAAAAAAGPVHAAPTGSTTKAPTKRKGKAATKAKAAKVAVVVTVPAAASVLVVRAATATTPVRSTGRVCTKPARLLL